MAHVQVQFAIDDAARADAIVETLLDEHLIACGQRVGPIRSRYWWGGRQEQADEWLVLMKTRAELAPAVLAAVGAHHPYETPEVVTLELVGGAADYLEWIDEVTAPATGRLGGALG
jgi:periplasmic divalent cation tolerance protein